MAQNTLTHRGTTTGYQPVGDEVRADARQPRAFSPSVGTQLRQPFTSPEPLGGAAPSSQAERQERQEQPEEGDGQEPDSWHWTARAEPAGPAYGGAAWNGGGGPLADAITNGDRGPAVEAAPARTAIGSGAGKVIAGLAEDVV